MTSPDEKQDGKRPWRTPHIERLRTHAFAAGSGTASEGAKVPNTGETTTIRLAAILFGGPS